MPGSSTLATMPSVGEITTCIQQSGNRLDDCCRHSLPHCFLSSAEAASVTEQCVSVSIGSPLAVRICDELAQTTLQHQLSILCNGPPNAALFIVKEKMFYFWT